MSYYGFPAYVSVAEKKEKARRTIERLRKKGNDIEPVQVQGKTLATTWWGKSWNKNLESYADYSNRISRGRSYLRNGFVLDMKIENGKSTALVMGSTSKPYRVSIDVDVLSKTKWNRVIELCNHRIDSLEELIEGKFPKEFEILFMERKYGMFPSPQEIYFQCSCPDGAYMCKHVAAVLYGIGTRLDKDPMLFFELRNVDAQELIKKSMESKLENMLKNASKKSKREIAKEDVFDIFGV